MAGVAFATHYIVANDVVDPSSTFAADLDGDGDLDVLSASRSDGKIAWYENTDGKGTFGPQQLITGDRTANSVYAADLDGDGDADVLTSGGWHENTDGKGTFGPQQVITGSRVVFAADLDGDGDIDVLSAGGNIAWYENADGIGMFGGQRTLVKASPADLPESVYAADVDGDGDVDVLSASRGDGKIAWYENTDGQGTFGPQRIITTEARGAFWVYAADLDGDGDLDVISAGNTQIAWHENTDGAGTFGPQQEFTNVGEYSAVHAADVDGDGDVDVLSVLLDPFRGISSIVWYENMDGKGTFAPQQVITTDVAGASSVYAADLDGDGDIDVLSGAWYDKKITWYENTDGKGTFGPQQVITTDVVKPASVYASDVDGDGDVDVLSASRDDDKIAWHENLSAEITGGDANRDGVFNQLDIVQVLQAAKYLTGEPATFEEGDWNNDGVFDQLDIVAALATGTYLQGPAALTMAKGHAQATDDLPTDEVDELFAV